VAAISDQRMKLLVATALILVAAGVVFWYVWGSDRPEPLDPEIQRKAEELSQSARVKDPPAAEAPAVAPAKPGTPRPAR